MEKITAQPESLRLLVIFLFGLLLLGAGIFVFRLGVFDETKIEILDNEAGGLGAEGRGTVVVEIAGAVEKPGVYSLSESDRVDNLLIAAGGLSANADREWVAKNLNRAAKLHDGEKIYIPSVGELAAPSVGGSGQVVGVSASLPGELGKININTASQAELESLPGIGPVRAQAIIENRPYQSVDELLSKKVIPNSVYQKIKERITAP